MEKFSHNAKNYVDTSWYTFITGLEQKAKFHNCLVIKSDRFYPSSKTCNHCGYVKKDLKLLDRTWICPQCGEEIQRDQNAAQNLRDNALKTLAEDIRSALLLEQEEVMSMEGMEVEICNSEIYGVSCEVEKTDCEVSQRSLLL